MVRVLPGRKLGPWSEFPFLYRFTVLLNSGNSNFRWSEFWSEFPHFMGMGVVPAPSTNAPKHNSQTTWVRFRNPQAIRANRQICVNLRIDSRESGHLDLQPPRPATGVSRALRARSVPGVSLGVSLGPFGPRAPECPKSVPRVSRECPRSVRTRF